MDPGRILPSDVVPASGPGASASGAQDGPALLRAWLFYSPIVAYWALGVAVALDLCSAGTVLLAAPAIAALALGLNLVWGMGRRLGRPERADGDR